MLCAKRQWRSQYMGLGCFVLISPLSMGKLARFPMSEVETNA